MFRFVRTKAKFLKSVAPLLLALLLPSLAAAQVEALGIRFQTFSSRQGLANNQVVSIAQDSHGFLWAGTQDGVSRFDGLRFDNFRLSIKDSAEVPNRNWVSKVKLVGRDIWASNELHELFRFDEGLGRFVFSGMKSPAVYLSIKRGGNKTDFHVDAASGTVWLIDGKNLLEFRPGAAAPVVYPAFEGTRNVGGILPGPDGRLWLAAQGGELCFDPKTGQTRDLSGGRRANSHLIAPPFLWFCNRWDTLFRIDLRSGALAALPVSPRDAVEKEAMSVEKVYRMGSFPGLTGDSIFWLALETGGIELVNWHSGRTVASFFEKNAASIGLTNELVLSLFNDRDSTLWLGGEGGLMKIDPSEQAFFLTNLPFFREHGYGRVRAVMSNPERLGRKWLLGNTGGLFDLDAATLTFKKPQFSPDDNANRMREMAPAPDGSLLVTSRDGLWRVAPDGTGRVFKPGFAGGSMVGNAVAAGPDSAWVANDTELGLLLLREGRFLPLKDSLPRIFTLQKGQAGSVIACTMGGLFRVGQGNFRAGCGCFEGAERIALPPGEKFTDAALDDGPLLWAMLNNGLGRLEKNTGRWTVFGEKEGLTNLRVRTVLKDRLGHLWLNSDNGLFTFFPEEGRFKRFDERDGLPQNLIGGLLSDDGDEFHACFMNAYSTWRPSARLRKVAATPIFTSFRALGRTVCLDADSLGSATFSVRHSENILYFNFTCLDFYQSDRITFEHQLDGFDERPVVDGAARSATYTNLDPGSYTLKVWAINADGYRSAEPAVLRFQVLPPYYRTWWFVGLCLAAAGWVVRALFQMRLRQRLEKEAIRYRIARDLHDEVGSTLSSISILSGSASGDGAEKNRLDGIGQQAREALDSMSDIVWAISPENDSFDSVVARMAAFAAPLLEGAGIELRFKASEGLSTIRTTMGQRRDLYLFFKEVVTNAARHSGASAVSVLLKKEGGQLLLEIRDDGRGFDLFETEGKKQLGGNGLRNLRSRAEALGGKFFVETRPGEGCRTELRLPIAP